MKKTTKTNLINISNPEPHPEPIVNTMQSSGEKSMFDIDYSDFDKIKPEQSEPNSPKNELKVTIR